MLEQTVDDTRLNGTYSVLVNVRPRRAAVAVNATNMTALLDLIAQQCQIWGGGNSPFVPAAVDGSVDGHYAAILAGSAIDFIWGLQDPFGLYRPSEIKVSPVDERFGWGSQLAVALLNYRTQEQYLPLEVVNLADGDPWRPIYAACLGLLAEKPAPNLLNVNRLDPKLAFEDFLHIERQSVIGSFDDLLVRLSNDQAVTPRQLSMHYLGYGNSGSTAIRAGGKEPLPAPDFARFDAGPNVVVVCASGSVEDIALLWNLRAAHGDHFVLPIGIPRSELTAEFLTRLVQHPRVSRNGISQHALYVTSASLGTEDLKSAVPGVGNHIAFARYDQMLTLGAAAGWRREEVLVWRDGESSIVPVPDERYFEVFSKPGFSQMTDMAVDVAMPTFPFPDGGDVRADGINWTFSAGAASRGIGRRVSEALAITWPSRMLSAQVVAERRDLKLAESEPGRAAMVALSLFDDVGELVNLAHAPLLQLLAEMAARQGMSWYRNRLRALGERFDPGDIPAHTAEDLPEKAFQDFKRILRNNSKAAENWLFWAERHGLIVKGFPLACPNCHLKQWTPVAAFAPPIICRGCSASMDMPFGDRPLINFKYRISERLRRVYEHDAVGHLLTMRYFKSIFSSANGSRLIGIHPGMEVRRSRDELVIGEADNLMLFRNADLVPVEVKRSFGGVLPAEVEKLTLLAKALRSPWSALAVCQYGDAAPDDFRQLESRGPGADPFRLILTYDLLLDPHPVWALGADPFAWTPLSDEEIQKREAAFVQFLAQGRENESLPWFDYSMLRRPGAPRSS